ncbi:biopolymer transporter ExbD [Desertifilum sp. FACHB-1129]|uniref:Biopolymer transporter ExbD n=1 Tax=Desertifilum tharense IPPAS B-1220 TaxID=1781255 RepID=A0A1E5QQ64_9CYAN|nr:MULTISPECIES: biopolymer transporter ExbD [Desertifilum]MDA0209175.1 biopolymer transporter ExbD [Cyanobacteria bacterium FC1]MBD2311829.1 biopolymer transporter ExbD [Desertifilum sp. FACHB-1129]MBD2322973.1 biopolymer transporter ExbD [Desertifilum sp. FACHB-866]MBD2333404.1 biopolymer transporter ExbD [Desertifilum sp. FACHB-868]OEJ76815.1 biopolymer transporter ExbD [Desertifilum tharense IPPAS B-1220]
MRLLDEDLDRPGEINIVPMIDVIFSILAFFIISSLYLTRSEGLPVNLPQAASSQTQRSAEVTVTVDRQGQIAINNQPIQLNQLEATLQQFIQPSQPTLVILNADEAVSHGVVVSVMDRLRQIEGARLAIATKRPQTNP